MPSTTEIVLGSIIAFCIIVILFMIYSISVLKKNAKVAQTPSNVMCDPIPKLCNNVSSITSPFLLDVSHYNKVYVKFDDDLNKTLEMKINNKSNFPKSFIMKEKITQPVVISF